MKTLLDLAELWIYVGIIVLCGGIIDRSTRL
ncbi:hypothetical protein KNU02_gp66 [Gordonia phage Pleakley]|uniref:Uncharacterized protein n=1 Tax=Gordonia phage Pleakley TaxID=2283246 RepID=A0A345M6I4_9CAUD|nr:hypothetical protein KNU02_gp66 [Gordonia phage Pleakley]AXH49822.1 hypothetical protein SEA_FURY_66 [Gordonia phage Fury]AXH66105.1 hypothetical protein SEA_PLEAKLEY_66 [Gordonia phage Pleakley]